MSATGGPVSVMLEDDNAAVTGDTFERFMFLGPGSYNDVSPLGDEDEDGFRDRGKGKGRERSETLRRGKEVSPSGSGLSTPQAASGQITTPETAKPDPMQAHAVMGEPIMGPPVLSIQTQTTAAAPPNEIYTSPDVPMLDSRERPFELPEQSRPDPVGIIAEMPTEATPVAQIELHPVPIEMPDNSILAPIETAGPSSAAELPTHSSPVESRDRNDWSPDEIRRQRQIRSLNQPAQRSYPFQPKEDDDPDRPPTPLGPQSSATAPADPTTTPNVQRDELSRAVVQPYRPGADGNRGPAPPVSQAPVKSPPIPPKTPVVGSEAGASFQPAQQNATQQAHSQFKITRKPTNAGAQPSKYRPYMPQGSSQGDPQRGPSHDRTASTSAASSQLAREASLMLPNTRVTLESSTVSILTPPQIPPKTPFQEAVGHQQSGDAPMQPPSRSQTFNVLPSESQPYQLSNLPPAANVATGQHATPPPQQYPGAPSGPGSGIGKFPSVLKPGPRPMANSMGPPVPGGPEASTGQQFPPSDPRGGSMQQYGQLPPQPATSGPPGFASAVEPRPGIQRVETTPNLPSETSPVQYKPFVPPGRGGPTSDEARGSVVPPHSQSAAPGHGFPLLQTRPHANSLPGPATQGIPPLGQHIAAQRMPIGQPGQTHLPYRPATVSPQRQESMSSQSSGDSPMGPYQTYSPIAANPQSFAQRVGSTPVTPSPTGQLLQNFPNQTQAPEFIGRSSSLSSTNSPSQLRQADVSSPTNTVDSTQSLQKTPPHVKNRPTEPPGPLQPIPPPGPLVAGQQQPLHLGPAPGVTESPLNFRSPDVSPPDARTGSASSGYPFPSPSPIDSSRQSSIDRAFGSTPGRPQYVTSPPPSTGAQSTQSGSQPPSSYRPSPLSTESGSTFISPPAVPGKVAIQPERSTDGYFPAQPGSQPGQGPGTNQGLHMGQSLGAQDTAGRRRSMPSEAFQQMVRDSTTPDTGSPGNQMRGLDGKQAQASSPSQLFRSASERGTSPTASPGGGQFAPPQQGATASFLRPIAEHPESESSLVKVVPRPSSRASQISQASSHRHSISVIPQPHGMLASGQPAVTGVPRLGTTPIGLPGSQQYPPGLVPASRNMPQMAPQDAYGPPGMQHRMPGRPGQMLYGPGSAPQSPVSAPGKDKNKWWGKILKTTKSVQRLQSGKQQPLQPQPPQQHQQQQQQQQQQHLQQRPPGPPPGQFMPLTGQVSQAGYQGSPLGPPGPPGMPMQGMPGPQGMMPPGAWQNPNLPPGAQLGPPGSSQRPSQPMPPQMDPGRGWAQPSSWQNIPPGMGPPGMPWQGTAHQSMPHGANPTMQQQQQQQQHAQVGPGNNSTSMNQQMPPRLQTDQMQQTQSPDMTPTQRTSSWGSEPHSSPAQSQSGILQTQRPLLQQTQTGPATFTQPLDFGQQQPPQQQPFHGRQSSGGPPSSQQTPSQRPVSMAESDRTSISTMDVSEAQAQPVLKPQVVQVARSSGMPQTQSQGPQLPPIFGRGQQGPLLEQGGQPMQPGPSGTIPNMFVRPGQAPPQTSQPMAGQNGNHKPFMQSQQSQQQPGGPSFVNTQHAQPSSFRPDAAYSPDVVSPATKLALTPPPLFSGEGSPGSPAGHNLDPAARASVISAASKYIGTASSASSSHRVSMMSTTSSASPDSSSAPPKRFSTFVRKAANKPKADYEGNDYGDYEDS